MNTARAMGLGPTEATHKLGHACTPCTVRLIKASTQMKHKIGPLYEIAEEVTVGTCGFVSVCCMNVFSIRDTRRPLQNQTKSLVNPIPVSNLRKTTEAHDSYKATQT